MKTLRNLIVPDKLYVNGRPAQVSDQIQLFLDTVNVPAFPEFIYGIITAVSNVKCSVSTAYDVEYNEADLDGAALALRVDDVVDYVVTDGLDAEIAARIAGDEAEAALRVAGQFAMQGDIDDEVAARVAGDAALQAEIDGFDLSNYAILSGPNSFTGNQNLTDGSLFVFGDFQCTTSTIQTTLNVGDSITSQTANFSSYFKSTPTQVAFLPVVTGLAGARSFVTDSNATLATGHGNIAVGSGVNSVPVYCDGTNWRIG